MPSWMLALNKSGSDKMFRIDKWRADDKTCSISTYKICVAVGIKIKIKSLKIVRVRKCALKAINILKIKSKDTRLLRSSPIFYYTKTTQQTTSSILYRVPAGNSKEAKVQVKDQPKKIERSRLRLTFEVCDTRPVATGINIWESVAKVFTSSMRKELSQITTTAQNIHRNKIITNYLYILKKIIKMKKKSKF
ncbi:hypothetical protein HELRODRAFT_171229 [Helobdella robusta]|uniref:Uncharacterized protein n=1 Tax=Helobdella robusta TaxID=6412 RepID=T1F3Y8_HELRO|nr:hypothetical protein HELRODRAFT_171229 [Helobdella robusta]ESO05581.1 hypothetical protein HELRODRAFT_171229 [Helobdella robusta]